MEEKERYVYHEVSNEVEQYECYYDTEECCELFDDKDILNRLNQQDKRIKELETCLDEEIESNVNLYNLRLKTEQESQQLKQQLAITEKALNLACKKVEERYTESEVAEGYGCNPNYFKIKAKEMLGNENIC